MNFIATSQALGCEGEQTKGSTKGLSVINSVVPWQLGYKVPTVLELCYCIITAA